jgi:hypothetical protein
MDRDQLRREVAFLQARIANTEEHIAKYRDKINARTGAARPGSESVNLARISGTRSAFEATMLQACEILLNLQVGIQEKLKQLLATSQR